MKRTNGLFDQVHRYETLRLAARRAQAGKRYRPDVLEFNHHVEDHMHQLSGALKDGSWRPSPHRHFRIYEPKVRWISAAPYPDRVVHHALCSVIEPWIDRRLIHDCWANRRGKGSHRAVLRYQRLAGRARHALKVDIRRYLPSIDHEILKRQFRGLFKDGRLLDLMDCIVDFGNIPEPHLAHFPGDDLFTPLERRKGLPIGNLTSQLWANLYMSAFDHWVCERLRPTGYVRFVDDFVLLHDHKSVLFEWREAIVERLARVRLKIHDTKSVVRRVDEGVPFLGYVVWPGRLRVRGETVRRFRRRHRRLQKASIGAAEAAQRLAAWRGHVQLAGGWRQCRGPG